MRFFNSRKKKKQIQESNIPKSKISKDIKELHVVPELEKMIILFDTIFQKDFDFSVRKFHVFGKTEAAIVFISSIVDKEKLERDIIKPLQENSRTKDLTKSMMNYINEDVLYDGDVNKTIHMKDLVEGLLRGKVVLLIDGQKEAFHLDAFKPEKRGITQPETERVVRGSRDGFIEQIGVNASLLRYRLPVPEFRVEQMEVGKLTKTKLAICYIDSITNEELVEEVRKRIERIDIDRILDAGYIEQYIQDNPRSPFPQVQNTERPDKAVGNIVEGRVVILIDGSPFALIVPAVFNQFYQTSEDYNERWLISSIIRLIRLAALIFSLTFSSFYVTVLSFHPELIPAQFVVAAASGRSGVPFPVVIEVLIMEFAMEILREATVRMPQQVGGALSIVGVLVIGQAAVLAGFVSPITVVIIALSTIGSFATPSYNAATAFRLLRFPLIILSGALGLLGLAAGLIIVMNHMLSIRSFGVPYMTPFSPLNITSLKDSFLRAPIKWLMERPSQLQPKDVIRENSAEKMDNPGETVNKGGN
ncbi:spore germination protein [Ornithinibacillus xuwenensis]|uniref:Spore germination protein n=1 Tax=Ornithinibacillus xuwenensis TaxID=3144668 RepID=A0ABU9XH20_9BACI